MKGTVKPTVLLTFTHRLTPVSDVQVNLFYQKACKQRGWFKTVVPLAKFNASICTDRNMSLPIVDSVDANYDLNMFIMNFIFGPGIWNQDTARSLGLFWFDQSVMLDAISSAENNYEWTTFSGKKLNFTKWGYGHPQLYDGVTFSAYYKPNSTDPPTVRVMNWHKICVLRLNSSPLRCTKTSTLSASKT